MDERSSARSRVGLFCYIYTKLYIMHEELLEKVRELQGEAIEREKELLKEKREMKGFISYETPDIIQPFERRQLRTQAVVLAGSQGYKRQDEMLKAAENIFQWIIKPE